MSTYILTSMFPSGFHPQIAQVLQENINKRNKFAFVASEFEKGHDKTDKYFRLFLQMFANAGKFNDVTTLHLDFMNAFVAVTAEAARICTENAPELISPELKE